MCMYVCVGVGEGERVRCVCMCITDGPSRNQHVYVCMWGERCVCICVRYVGCVCY